MIDSHCHLADRAFADDLEAVIGRARRAGVRAALCVLAADDPLETVQAGRVADLLELGELMMVDALHRNESCGGHFREEYQTPENEALRDDENYAYVAAWEYKGEGQPHQLHKEILEFENVKLTQRSYK